MDEGLPIKHEDLESENADSRALGKTSLEAFSSESSPARSEKLKRGIKIVIGGPPHSGKTVFYRSLLQALPSAYPLSASPDGEGAWTQTLYSQGEVDLAQRYRQKGTFTSEFRADYRAKIDSWDGPLMIIDMGGKPTPEDTSMLEGATHGIILASDLSKVSEWRDFFAKNGIDVIATLHSHFDGSQDYLLPDSADRGEVIGSVHHLARGESVIDTATTQKVVSLIQRLVDSNSAYFDYQSKKPKDPAIVHVAESFEDLPKDPETGRTLPGAVPVIYREVAAQERRSAVWLSDVKCSWETMAFVLAYEENGASDVRVDAYGSYIPVKLLPESEGVDAKWWSPPQSYGEIDGRPVYVVHNRANSSTNLVTPADLDNMTVPTVPVESIVIISGAGPNWLKSSIASSYRGKVHAIAGFQPGTGSTVVWSRDQDFLGKVLPGNV